MNQESNNAKEEIVLDKKTKERYINLLVSVYNLNLSDVEQMSDTMLHAKLTEQQDKSIINSKNPNRFWIFNNLPAPTKHKTTTSSKVGWIVFIIFILLLLIAGLIFMILALVNHNIL